MKSINGNNKLERQINKAKKFLGIELVDHSNQYLKINDIEDKGNTYIILGEGIKYSKLKDLFILKPLNSNGRVFFVKEWAAISEMGSYYYGDYVIFKPYKEEDKILAKELSKGYDDLYNLEEFIRKNGLFLVKQR